MVPHLVPTSIRRDIVVEMRSSGEGEGNSDDVKQSCRLGYIQRIMGGNESGC